MVTHNRSPRGLLGFLIAGTCILLLVGTSFLLLLNGQVFTNTIVFLALCSASLILWVPLLFFQTHRRLGIGIVLAHIVLAVSFLPGLPAKRTRQADFNQKMQELRQSTVGDRNK